MSAPVVPPFSITLLRDSLYQVTGGSGANSGILVGKEHLLLIDAKMTADTVHELSALIQTQFAKPVSTILLTHSDIDHVGGIDFWPEPFSLISNEISRNEIIEQAARVKIEHLPDITFNQTHRLEFEGTRLELIHIGPAHTAGDSLVLFPDLRVAFVGDVLFFNRDPLIHRHKGGSSTGLRAALNFLLTLDVDLFASGHSDPVGKTEIEQLRNSIAKNRDEIHVLVEAGLNWEEIKKQLDLKDVVPPPGRPRFPSIAEVIYLEVAEAGGICLSEV